MQLIKIVLHGSLKGRFDELTIAGSTPAEAIEGWSRQVGMGDLPMPERPLIQVIGHKTDASLYEKTDLTELHLVPAMLGGGGKGMSIGQIIIGAALIIGGIFLLPSNPALGTALITAGIGLFVGGVMGLFMKQPTLSKEEDPEASKYIGTGKNTTAIGTIIGHGGGRMMIGGQYLSLQVNANDMIMGSFPATPT